MHKEESSISDDSRPKKPTSSQPLGERVDSVANTAAGKSSNTTKASSAGKKPLPATIMEESESEEPMRPKASSSVAKEDKAPAGEKKKKRKLGALLGGTTFTWDQNLVSARSRFISCLRVGRAARVLILTLSEES